MSAAIGGLAAVVCVYLGHWLGKRQTTVRDERASAIKLGEIAAVLSRVEDGQGDLWTAVNGLRTDVGLLRGRMAHPAFYDR